MLSLIVSSAYKERLFAVFFETHANMSDRPP